MNVLSTCENPQIVLVGISTRSYDVALLADAGTEILHAMGIARLVNHIVILRADLDLASVPPGSHSLGFRQPGLKLLRFPGRVFWSQLVREAIARPMTNARRICANLTKGAAPFFANFRNATSAADWIYPANFDNLSNCMEPRLS